MTHLRALTLAACLRWLAALFPIVWNEACKNAWLQRAELGAWRGGGSW